MSTLYVSKENIINNLNSIKEKLNKNTKIIAMVKAIAYGTDMFKMAKLLKSQGITDFGVALVSEGIALREVLKTEKIIVTSGAISKEDIENAIKNELTLSVSDKNICKIINDIASKIRKKVNVHIAVDTGMTRLGFDKKDIVNSILQIHQNYEYIDIEGIYTHLSCADFDDKFTREQLDVFDFVVKELLNKGINFKYIHALNSDGSFRYSEYEYTHIRVGMLMYGYNNTDKILLKPALKLTTNVIHVKDIAQESKVSYGATHLAKTGDKVAVIQIGYADGLFRCLSNNYYVEINGKKCKIIGSICMDMCMVDVSGLDVKVGDEVIVFDFDNDLNEMAKKCNTISYEIISRIGNRVKRIFI